MALRDVMDHVVEVQKEVAKPNVRVDSNARTIWMSALCGVLVVFAAWSWVTRPEFIWGANPKNVPAARVEADSRIGMFLMGRRIEAYRKTNGAYPTTLAAIGESNPAIGYRVVSDSVFELSKTVNGKTLVMRSNESPQAFLGTSAAVIMGHAK